MNGSASCGISIADKTRVLTPRFLQSVLQHYGIHHGGQHADVVGRRPIHLAGALRNPAKDVAPADDDRDLHAEFMDLLDLFGD